MLHHASNQRGAVCLILTTPPLPLQFTPPPQWLVSQHLGSLINTTELLVQLEIPPPACQPPSKPLYALLLLFLPHFSALPQSLSLLSSQQDAPPLGCSKTTPSFWRAGMKVRRQHSRDKGAGRKGKKGGARAREEWKRMFGLVDRLPPRSQRAPFLSADVDIGEVVESVYV